MGQSTKEPLTVEQWIKILGDLPAPEGLNPEKLMAGRILANLKKYDNRGNGVGMRIRDTEELANAIIAYGRMMFDAGVRP